jgi:hypothetical protein
LSNSLSTSFLPSPMMQLKISMTATNCPCGS